MGEGLTPRDNYCLRNGHSGAIALNARIAELEAELRQHHANVWANCAVCDSTFGVQSALPDTEGRECPHCHAQQAGIGTRCGNCHRALPDTEGEQE